MKKIKLAYFGTPDFSARFLEKLLKDKEIPVEVRLVVTQQDRKVGRKQVLTASPVKQMAKALDIQIKVSSRKNLMSSLMEVDLALLFAYGEIIPKEILTAPKYGFWNIHPSLLPKYRGAAPVAWTLINGEKETGVTLMKMDEKMDHGSIIAQEKLEIKPEEKRPELTLRLTDLAFEMFKKLINKLHDTNYKIQTKEQNHSRATYTKLLKKDDGFVEISNIKYQISKSPEKLFNLFRGLYPWPGIWTKVVVNGKEKRLKITDMSFENKKLVIKKVQLEGKKEASFEEFNRAYGLF